MTEHPITIYRKTHGLTLEAFGALIGATKSAVWKWENWVAEPRRKHRIEIIRVTGGEITAADFLEPADTAAE